MLSDPHRRREIVRAILSLAILFPLGIYLKRSYVGPAAAWVHDSLGGVLYVIFWSLAAVVVLPRVRAWRIVLGVLLATCVLEFMQLWHPPLLEAARRNFIGRTILGSFFDWSDFPYYFAGAPAGWIWLRAIGRR